MKKVLYVMCFLAFVAIALGLWIRLAPSDPAIWHLAITDQTPATPRPCADQIRTEANGARATCLLADDPATVLARLGATALATPRTTQLAATEGMITWITRSKLFGFPDYTTAQVRADPQGTRLDIHARQRFGTSDLGVNTARLKIWLTGF